jgi:hypothetical protein
MIKKIMFLLVLALLFGCASNKPAETISQEPVAVQAPVKVCPSSCDDSNKCTADSCSKETSFECVNKKISPCCGDMVCDADESCTACVDDCGSCYTLDNLKADVNAVYKKEVVYQSNNLNPAREKYEDLKSSSYKYYSSTYITIYEITNKAEYISSPESFENFAKALAEKKVSLMSSLLPVDYPAGAYTFSVSRDVSTIEKSSSAWLVKSVVWAALKKGTRFEDPEKSISVYVYCRPNLIAEIYSRQPESIETFWQNLDSTGYNAQKGRLVNREIGNAVGDAAKISSLCFQKKASVAVAGAEGISFNVKSIEIEKEYLPDYDMVYGFWLSGFNRKIKLKGELVNNLDESIDNINVVLRLYNEKAKTAESQYISRTNLAVGMMNITLREEGSMSSSTTPYYTDIFKPVYYLGLLGKAFPPKSSGDVDVTFSYGVPDWDGQLYDYNSEFKSWTVGNYDVDHAELIVLRDGKVVYAKEIELPQAYVRDTRLVVDRLDASYGNNTGSIDAVSFTINNSGGTTDVSMPRVKVVLKELVKEGNFAQNLGMVAEKELSSVELDANYLVKIATDESFRFSLSGLSPIALGSQTDKKGYMLYFWLYEGDKLLDKKGHLITAESRMYTPTIYNPEIITYVDPLAYGYNLKIGEITTEKSAEGKKGVKLTIDRAKNSRPDFLIKRASIDLFCGSTLIYSLGDEMGIEYNKQIFIPFDWGNCVGLVANLRDGNQQRVYAAAIMSTPEEE